MGSTATVYQPESEGVLPGTSDSTGGRGGQAEYQGHVRYGVICLLCTSALESVEHGDTEPLTWIKKRGKEMRFRKPFTAQSTPKPMTAPVVRVVNLPSHGIAQRQASPRRHRDKRRFLIAENTRVLGCFCVQVKKACCSGLRVSALSDANRLGSYWGHVC